MLVGYSGGADSTCLLQLLVLSGIEVVAAHLHHGQRAEADGERERCAEFCEQLDVPFVPGNADVPAMAGALRMGLEEAGRRARYAFFEQAAAQTGCATIATAHTRDDLLETMLLNLARGTGLAGLGGIPESRDRIVRPLLPFTRAETRAYCDDRGLWYHDDPSNDDLSFARARVRHRVLPELRLCHPGCDASLVRLARLAGEEDAFLDAMAAAALERCEIPLNGPLRFLTLASEACFDRTLLAHVPRPLARRGVRLAAGALGGAFDFDQAERVIVGMDLKPKGSITASGGGVKAVWTPETLWVSLTAPVVPFRQTLERGETASESFGWRFEVYDGVSDGSVLCAALAPDSLRGGLHFRTAKKGDAIDTGKGVMKDVADLMSESKLTPIARATLPVVCDMLGPVWVPGLRVSSRAAAKPAEHALCVRLGPLSDAESHNEIATASALRTYAKQGEGSPPPEAF